MWITSSSFLSFSHPCHLALRYHVTDGTSEFLLTEQSALCKLPKKTEQLVILFLSLHGVTHCESNLLCLWTAALCVLLLWDYFNTTFTWIGPNCSSTVFVLHTKFVTFKVKLTCNFIFYEYREIVHVLISKIPHGTVIHRYISSVFFLFLNRQRWSILLGTVFPSVHCINSSFEAYVPLERGSHLSAIEWTLVRWYWISCS